MIGKACSCCLYTINFGENEESAVCPACGQVNTLTRFETRIDPLKQSEEEKSRLEAELRETEDEKARLDRELGESLSNLDSILAGQTYANGQLAELMNAARKADGKQDALHDLLTALGSASGDHTKQLAKLGDLSGRILDSQGDLTKQFGLMNEIMTEIQQLKLDAAKKNELFGSYSAWSMNIQKEDAERLEAIRKASGELLDYRKTLDSALSDLKKRHDEIMAKVDSFHDEYSEDKRRKLTALYRSAEELQASKKFPEAEAKYHEVVENGGAETEVYWRILLCHYGVEYVKDDKNGGYAPTMYDPDLTPPDEMPEQKNLRGSLEKADAAVRKSYEDRVAALNAIIETYRTVRFNESYDVFISVKQNDNGHITADSDKGSELYDKLTGWGLKVFNSRRTKLRPGVEFEPQIISALMSAKVMIVVGTKKEYMEAKWVQNEWRRFRWLVKNDKENKRLLFCYLANGMKAKEIPAALDPGIQAIVEGIDSESRLKDAMKAVFPENKTLNPDKPAPVPPVSVPDVKTAETKETFEKKLAPMLFRRDFAAVIREIDNVSTFELLSAKTVLFRACAEREITSVKQLLHTVPDLRADEYIQNITEYLDEAEAEKLDGMLGQDDASVKPEPENPEPKAGYSDLDIEGNVYIYRYKNDENGKLLWEQRVKVFGPSSGADALAPDEFPAFCFKITNNGSGEFGFEKAYARIDDGEKLSWPAGAIKPGATEYYHIWKVNMDKVRAGRHTVDLYIDDRKAATGNLELIRPDASPVKAETPRKPVGIGDSITMGRYGGEPIEWRVLDRDGNRALLISRYGLDAKPYNEKFTEITWENCTLRKWLNNDFIDQAFTAEEQKGILLTNVGNGKSQGCSKWNTDGGNDTKDKVFLLSYAEAWKYFGSDEDRMCAPTDYAVDRGAYTDDDYKVDGKPAGWWWLRSPGDDQHYAACVSGVGSRHDNFVDSVTDCVRPALWVDLSSEIF